MKKNILSLFLLTFITSTAYSGTFQIIGPCDKKPVVELVIDSIQGMNAGEVTIKTLDQNSIKYIGSAAGMSSILDTPTGLDAMDVISDTEMHAYGWCYSVNDVEPSVYPDKIILEEDDQIIWWFGYGHYKDGKWLSMCEPSYLLKSETFCKQTK